MTQERLKELFDYNPVTGTFHWKVRRRSRGGVVDVGQEAGWREQGCIRIKVDQRTYLAHRLAWFYVHGVWPKGELDHCNRDREDNRIENLREATHGQNGANRKVMREGLKGCYVDKRKPTWQWHAKLKKNRKTIYLGCFRTELEAHQAYLAGARKLHGDFARAA
jgi:hypothetical protein